MDDKVILLVEDNRDDEELTLLALEAGNIKNQVVVVRDGAEALDYLFGTGPYASRGETAMPVVVLLDLKLPKLDGLEVLRRLRADPRTETLPVVVLTSSTQQEDVVASYDLHANSYVRKPVNIDQFGEAVRHLGLYWVLLNTPPPRHRPGSQ